MRRLLLSICLFLFLRIDAQFDPQVGSGAKAALFKDSSIFVNWANGCTVQRGYVNISHKPLGLVTFGTPENAIGKADGRVVSLGDSGIATITFEMPLYNGDGPDFAVFENGIRDMINQTDFLELAFVEVSSNGVDFVRFPAISLVDNTTQTTSFGTTNAALVHNLAGKYLANYGTPFDLEDIKTVGGIDVMHITHVRIIDVVGSVSAPWGSRDSRGVFVNDPFPTPFSTCGFDLDAVGVIHQKSTMHMHNDRSASVSVYPNPVTGNFFYLINPSEEFVDLHLYDCQGNNRFAYHTQNVAIQQIILPEDFSPGLYTLIITLSNRENHYVKLMVFQ